MNLARRPAAFTAVLVAAGALGTGAALAFTADEPDQTFNNGTPLAIDLPGRAFDYPTKVALGPTGSLALLGGDTDSFPQRALLGRVTPAGAPDDAFGDHGVLEDPIPDMNGFGGVKDIAVDGDDQVLIGLETGAPILTRDAARWGTDAEDTDGDFTVIRYAADGTREGVSRLDVSAIDDAQLVSVVPQADGGVLVTGTVGDYAGEGDAIVHRTIVVRLNPDGTRDMTFGTDGAATIANATAIGAGAQPAGPAGSVVVVAKDAETGEIVLRRILGDGSVDATYGGQFPWPSEYVEGGAQRSVVGRDGTVYVFTPTGMTSGDVGRYTAEGQPDTAWAGDGVLKLSELGVGYYVGRSFFAGDAAGHLLVTGYGGDENDGVVARASADGSGLDPAFGDAGLYHLPDPAVEDAQDTYGTALAIQDDGRIVVGGQFSVGSRTSTDERNRVAALGDRQAFVLRLGAADTTTTTTPPATTTTTTTATTPPATTTATTPAPAPQPVAGAGTPAPKACASRRSFSIHLRIPKGKKAKSAVVKVNGKTVKTLTGKRITAPVDLRGLPKGQVTVSITVKLSSGKSLKGSRQYKTCTPRGAEATIPVL